MTAVRLAYVGEGSKRIRDFPRHAHPYPILIWYTRGRGHILLDDGSSHAFARDVLVGVPASLFYRERSLHGFTSLFIALEHLALPELIACPLGSDPRFGLAARLLLEESRRTNADARSTAPALAAVLLALERYIRPQPGSILVRDCLALFHTHADDAAFTVRSACRRLGVAPRQLRTRFLQELGVTPLQHLLGLRIDQASRLLLGGGFQITSIAERCGFQDPFYFARSFRRRTGMSPSAYRAAHARPG